MQIRAIGLATVVVCIGSPTLAQVPSSPMRVREFPGGIRINLPVTKTLAHDALWRVIERSPKMSLRQALSELPAALTAKVAALERLPPHSPAGLREGYRILREALDAKISLETVHVDEPQKQILCAALDKLILRAEDGYRARIRAVMDANRFRMESEAIEIGRTLTLTLEDGSILAVKRQDRPRREAAMMARGALFGLSVPIPLTAGESELRGRYWPTVAYLVPPEMARDYFTYLGDRLTVPLEARQTAVRDAALKSIDQLSRLERHGHYHSSLAALSHSGTLWDWRYWRPNRPWLWFVRYGPTSIHDWISAMKYPNMRLSGLADFEHIDSWGEHPEVEGAQIYGQNLLEWSLATLHAARNNGLSSREAAGILHDGVLIWMSGQIPDVDAVININRLQSILRNTARKFFIFADFNDAVAGLLKIRGAFILPGAVVHPWIKNGISPLVALTQKKTVQQESIVPAGEGYSFFQTVPLSYVAFTACALAVALFLETSPFKAEIFFNVTNSWILEKLSVAVGGIWTSAYLRYLWFLATVHRDWRRPWISKSPTSEDVGN